MFCLFVPPRRDAGLTCHLWGFCAETVAASTALLLMASNPSPSLSSWPSRSALPPEPGPVLLMLDLSGGERGVAFLSACAGGLVSIPPHGLANRGRDLLPAIGGP